MADDVGDGLARDPPLDERIVETAKCRRQRIPRPRQERRAIAVQHVTCEHLCVERRFVRWNAGANQPIPGVGKTLVERRHQCTVGPEFVSSSEPLSVASFSFSDEVGHGGVDEIVESAVERLGELVHREPDAVVGDAVLAEVVGPDLFERSPVPTCVRRSLAMASCCFRISIS
jgi:hypothetical protein